jgi:hypothetical protein
LTENDVIKLGCIGDTNFGGCYTLFTVEGINFMTYTAHEPAMLYLFEMYQKYAEYVPDKALREQLGKRFHYMSIFSEGKSYTFLCLLLKIMTPDPETVFNSPEIWAEDFERYTYSRAFLETLLEDLTECGETKGALIVVKKLSELDSDRERFTL